MLAGTPAFLITLDRKNERRALNTYAKVHSMGFTDITFVDAVDGRKINDISSLTTLRAQYELKNGRYVHEAISCKGAIGCYLSHIEVWKKCVKLNRTIVVFEDDFVPIDPSGDSNPSETLLRSIHDAIDKDYDILRFAYYTFDGGSDSGSGTVEITPYLSTIKNVHGTGAYFITPRGAKKLLSRALPINTHVDHYISMVANLGHVREYFTPYSLHQESGEESTLSHTQLKRYPDLTPSGSKGTEGTGGSGWVVLLSIIIIFLIIAVWLIWTRKITWESIKLRSLRSLRSLWPSGSSGSFGSSGPR